MNGETLLLRHGDRTVTTLDLDRWVRPADDADRHALLSVVAPALDVGCGPGRIVEALQLRGIRALGIDIAGTAVTLARARGANARRYDVFGRVPAAGTWQTVLLLDGNIGIGGDPAALLTRALQLLAPSGIVLVEAHEEPGMYLRSPARFVRAGQTVGPTFPWALVGRHALERIATTLGYRIEAAWTSQRRAFMALRAPAGDPLS
ncbi:methyltransferase domain-containing protein [uncultured Jatrophihabitans sp.]|uniref:methyltransferase domain-containing protein n=1 Tax=uncultured Jatrophihabitans sp. TaxID=1610747 RepID=UPI0035CC8B1B